MKPNSNKLIMIILGWFIKEHYNICNGQKTSIIYIRENALK